MQTSAKRANDGIYIAFCNQIWYIYINNLFIIGQATVTIRMDADIKRQFDALCQDFGMSANTAFNIFARSVVRSRSIPFEIQADSKETIAAKTAIPQE